MGQIQKIHKKQIFPQRGAQSVCVVGGGGVSKNLFADSPHGRNEKIIFTNCFQWLPIISFFVFKVKTEINQGNYEPFLTPTQGVKKEIIPPYENHYISAPNTPRVGIPNIHTDFMYGRHMSVKNEVKKMFFFCLVKVLYHPIRLGFFFRPKKNIFQNVGTKFLRGFVLLYEFFFFHFFFFYKSCFKYPFTFQKLFFYHFEALKITLVELNGVAKC